MSDDLLAELAGRLHCYISDLPRADVRAQVLSHLNQINQNAYSPAIWNETLSYLFKERLALRTHEQVRAFLIEKIGKL